MRVTVTKRAATVLLAGILAGASFAQEPERQPAPEREGGREPAESQEVEPAQPQELDEIRSALQRLAREEQALRRRIEELRRSLKEQERTAARREGRRADAPSPRRLRPVPPRTAPDQEGGIWREFADDFGSMPRLHGLLQTLGELKVQVHQEDDGSIHLEVRRQNAQGAEDVESYDAGSAEELRQRHGDLLRDLGLEIGEDGRFTFTLRRLPGLLGEMPGFDTIVPSLPQGGRNVLGVMVEELSAERQQELGLEAGQGLAVVSVTPGSLADRLGVEDGDVLVSIQDGAVTGPDTIRDALRRTDASATVKVKVLRDGSKEPTELSAPKAGRSPRRTAR